MKMNDPLPNPSPGAGKGFDIFGSGVIRTIALKGEY